MSKATLLSRDRTGIQTLQPDSSTHYHTHYVISPSQVLLCPCSQEPTEIQSDHLLKVTEKQRETLFCMMIRLMRFITTQSAKGNSFRSWLRTNETSVNCFKGEKQSNNSSKCLLSTYMPGNLYVLFVTCDN